MVALQGWQMGGYKLGFNGLRREAQGVFSSEPVLLLAPEKHPISTSLLLKITEFILNGQKMRVLLRLVEKAGARKRLWTRLRPVKPPAYKENIIRRFDGTPIQVYAIVNKRDYLLDSRSVFNRHVGSL